MSANFEGKKVLVAEIHGKLKDAKSLVLVDYMGIDVDEVTRLRKECREAGVDYKVYKNKLVKRATEGTQFEEINKDLVGPNAFVFSYDDATAPARVLKKFAKDSKTLELKSGIIEGVYYDAQGIEKIADIPSREVLISKILGSIKSPLVNLAYLLKAIADKKAEGGDVAPVAEQAQEAEPVVEASAAEEAPVAEEAPAAEEAATEE